MSAYIFNLFRVQIQLQISVVEITVLKQSTARSRYAINRNGKVRIFASNQIRDPIH